MAVGTGAAILGSAIVGGISSQQAAKKASKASSEASGAAIAEQQRQFDILQEQAAPYRLTGQAALSQYANQLGLAVPDYNALTQQQTDIDNQIAALQQQAQTANMQNSPAYQELQLIKSFPTPGNQQRRLMLEEQVAKEAQGMPAPAEIQTQINQLQQQRAGLQNQLAPTAPGQQAPAMGQPGQAEQVLPTFQAPGEAANLPTFQFNLEEDPGYQFAVDQAVKAATRTAAGRGQRLSGNLLAEVTGLGAGLASQYANQAFQRQMAGYGAETQRAKDIYGRALGEYGLGYQRAGDIYGRGQDYLNRLAALSGVGQTTTMQTGQMGMGMASNIGNLLSANAANQAGAAQLQYGGFNQAIQGGLGNYLAYQQNQQNQQFLDRLLPPPPATNQPAYNYSTYGPYASDYKWGA